MTIAMVAGLALALAPARWIGTASPGNTVEIRGAHAVIHARLNTHAFASRRPASACPTLTARVRPSVPAGVTWSTSLFVWWDDRTWIQVAVVDGEAGPSCYLAEAIDGAVGEYRPAPAPAQGAVDLRLEVGADCLRWLVRGPAGWRTLRAVRRDGARTRPPALLAVGKGYGSGVAPYARPGLANDYADPGPAVTSVVEDIAETATPVGRLRLTPAEAAARSIRRADPVAAVELRGVADPTFERVARWFPPMRHPRELLGVPGHSLAVGLDQTGRLELDGDRGAPTANTAWVEVNHKPLFSPGAPPSRALREGGAPIVALAGAGASQEAFAASESMAPAGDLFAFIKLHIPKPDGSRCELVLAPGGARIPLLLDARGEAAACIPVAHPDQAGQVSLALFNRTAERSLAFWRTTIGAGTRIVTPDPRVNDAWRTWLAYALLDTKQVDGRDEPHDGRGFYRMIYGYSAALHCIVLDEYGRHDRARRCLETLLHFQQPDGLYTQNFGLPDHGALLVALRTHLDTTGDLAWVRSRSDRVVRAAEWIVRQRAKAPASGPVRGLIRWRPYCDYPEPTVDYFSDTWCCMGLESSAALLRAAGRGDDAARFADEAVRYRADILRSMDRAMLSREGLQVLPMEPLTHRLLKSTAWRGGGYWGLVAGCLLESGFLAPRDPRAQVITTFMERAGGLIGGVSEFDGGIDHAYAFGYLQTQLRRGEARKVILGLNTMMAHGMTRTTWSAVECTQTKTGENAGTLPHLYSCTQQLRLLRAMLVREEGPDLVLMSAAPRAWFRDGRVITVERAATRFGPVSFTARTAAGRTDVTLDLGKRTRPRRVQLLVRRADGAPVRSASSAGRALPVQAGVVILPGAWRGGTISVR